MSMKEQDETQILKKMEHVVKESFEIVKKWLKKSFKDRIPCYNMTETELELDVCLFNSV